MSSFPIFNFPDFTESTLTYHMQHDELIPVRSLSQRAVQVRID